MLGICAGLRGPKTENVEKVLVFIAFFKRSREPRADSENEQGMARRGFGITLGSLWSHFGVILGSLGSLWVYESYFGVISGARLTHGFVEGALISHFWRSLGLKFSNYCNKNTCFGIVFLLQKFEHLKI